MINYTQIQEQALVPGTIDKLIARFFSQEELNKEQMQLLYYGYSYTEAYTPNYRNTAYEEFTEKLLRQDGLQLKEINELRERSLQVLDEYPFYLPAIWNLARLEDMEEEDESVSWFSRAFELINTIKSSGDGLSPQTAWHVIDVAHEQEILVDLELQFKGTQQLIENRYDYLEVESEAEDSGFEDLINEIPGLEGLDFLQEEKKYAEVEGVYFNVERCIGKA